MEKHLNNCVMKLKEMFGERLIYVAAYGSQNYGLSYSELLPFQKILLLLLVLMHNLSIRTSIFHYTKQRLPYLVCTDSLARIFLSKHDGQQC